MNAHPGPELVAGWWDANETQGPDRGPLHIRRQLERWLMRQPLTMHQLWWVAVSAVNTAFVVLFCATTSPAHLSVTTLSLGNLLVATLIRNDSILHLLYRLAVWL